MSAIKESYLKKGLKIIIIFILIFFVIGNFLFLTRKHFEISNYLWSLLYSPIFSFLRQSIYFLLSQSIGYFTWKLFDFLFLFGIILVVITNSVIYPLAFFHYFKKEKKLINVKRWPPVTILIPAYNEEVNIARTIQTVYNAKYKGDKEIIVINDGSSDRTRDIAEEYVNKGMIELINRVNGGKTCAINTGLISARGEIIVVIDGDGIIKEDALEELIKVFSHPNIGAVAGNIKVANRVNFVSKIQHLEYVREINIPRRAFNMLNCVMVVPGPLGAFRRDMLYSIGTYDHDTKTEDFDVTIKILKAKKYKIEVTQNALAYTEAPIYWRDLYKQRMRWYGGMFETLKKHKDIIGFNKSQYGNLGRFGGVYTFFTLTIAPFMELFVFASLAVYFVSFFNGLGNISSPLNFLIPFFSFILMEVINSCIALAMEKEKLYIAVWSIAFIFPYRQFLNVIKIIAFFKVLIFKKEIKWNKIERTGIPPGQSLE